MRRSRENGLTAQELSHSRGRLSPSGAQILSTDRCAGAACDAIARDPAKRDGDGFPGTGWARIGPDRRAPVNRSVRHPAPGQFLSDLFKWCLDGREE